MKRVCNNKKSNRKFDNYVLIELVNFHIVLGSALKTDNY